MANLSCFATGDYKESLRKTSRALALKPNYVEAHQFISYLYTIAGEKEKALHHLDIALGLDPLSQETLFYSAFYDYMEEDYEKSLEKLDRSLAHNPKNIAAHMVKCHCLLMTGRYDEVINYFDNMPPAAVLPGDKVGLTGLAYALKKDSTNTTRIITQLSENAKGKNSFNADSYLFLLYAVTGKNEQAFEWIGRAIENKYPLLLLRFADPLVNPIKEDPRYMEFQKIIFAKEPENNMPIEKEALSI